MRRAVSRATWALIVLALLGLAGTTVVALAAISRANQRVIESREVVAQFQLLQQAVSEEAYAEAGYLRAPDDDSWQRLLSATSAVPPLISRVREQVDRSDGMTLSHLSVLNARYAAQVAGSRRLDHGEDRIAGPALDAMVDLLTSSLTQHRSDVTATTRQQATLIRRLSFLLPGVFLIAFGLVAWALRLTMREQRRLSRESAAHRTLALTDGLTGLPNRAALLARMRLVLGRPHPPAAVLFLDLDKFKPVNDTWGHFAGDLVLQEVARRLQDAIRADDLAARLGGDEFAVFLPGGAGAEGVAQRIMAAFEQPFTVDGVPVELHLGTSIGIARSDVVGSDSGNLLRAADEALYRVKQAGRGGVALARSRTSSPVEPSRHLSVS